MRLFVSLNQTYPELNTRTHESISLRVCTSCAWRINAGTADGVKYVFGVYQGKVVSAYRVDVPSTLWPQIPSPAEGEGRRFIPVRPVPLDFWNKAIALKPPRFCGGVVRYANVTEAADHLSVTDEPAKDEELVE